MLIKNTCLVNESFQVERGKYILIENDRISYIGDKHPEGYFGETYNGENKVVLPGFFNNHCHVPMTLLRGYGEGLPLHRWLAEKMFPFEAKLTGEDIYWGSLLGIAEMIKSGVVSFTDMYFEIEMMAQAVSESGIKVNLSHGLSYNSKKPSIFELQGYKDTERLLDIASRDKTGRLKIDIGLHAEYTSRESLVREVAHYARERNLIVHTHLSETQGEHDNCKLKYGKTPAEYFAECGLFDQPTTAAHCVWVEDSDIEIIKSKGVVPVHCPSSNMKLGSGFAPIKQMIEAGIPVTIGTDGASSNNNLNMVEEIYLAAMINKGSTQDPEFMYPAQLLKLATINGARAQDREDCGSIKVGNKADLVIFDMDKPHLQPVFDELANILYSGQSDDICMTMIDGQIVYKDGEFKTIDIEKVMHKAVGIKERILSELV
ncbi:amidohydrolase [Gudongella oleilytica]|jgi:5-methylthioadenosine/S-adenosylhomocysteine deaminase|uniref:amidohydrolase n=1 Tax=Gudongella oleilytica TaxID=1582259 RepID=UPI000FF87D4D|nr:amidohydrolase [Gudongella oleilytica]